MRATFVIAFLIFQPAVLLGQQFSSRDAGLQRIQPGDQVEIRYRITPEYNETVTVQSDGFVNLETTGSIKLAHLTTADASALIAQRASKLLNNPEVSVILKEFETPYFVVAGEVDKPGRYDMHSDVTAVQAVLIAGGMKNTARSSQVVVFRRINDTDADVKVLDLRNIKSKQGLERDLQLESGDMLLVPRSRFTVVERVVKLMNLGVYFNPTSPF